jgi:hypothetical protein
VELLLIRHALPVRIEDGDGPADPALSEAGHHQARLLADLTRPESRDRWARLMAKRLGWGPGRLIAPGLHSDPGRSQTEHADYQPPGWWLMDDCGNVQFFTALPEASEEIGGTYVADLPLDPTKGIEAFWRILHTAFGVPLARVDAAGKVS